MGDTLCLQEQYKRTLLLPTGKVTVAKLLEFQQRNPPEQLRLEIEPLARFGASRVGVAYAIFLTSSNCPKASMHLQDNSCRSHGCIVVLHLPQRLLSAVPA